ncbi:hypothetical protein DPMN_186457 [Dreissena polymorpha]|uniref:Uncharacterized protein n=1 Tax=Dreissena polymorpha TaxID=45954 RepID=A0A9D4DMY3_DREPO|nr:hypothetical protein DPMN_186457 [Dreissena polymorpha]
MTSLGAWVALTDFRCPVRGCPSTRGVNWVCSKDGDQVYINALGKMECYHGTHSGDICSWGWNCGRGTHRGEYRRADFEDLTFALSQSVQFMSKTGSQWVANLMKELGKQFSK